MKKLLLPVLALFLIASVNAQEVKFGAKGGVNFASLSGDDADGLDGRTSIHFGVVANIGISESFSVQPELLYSSQGFTLSEMGFDITGKLDYIILPVLADFKVAEGFSLQAGPQIGFVVTDKVEAEGESEDLDAESTDFGAVFGAQFKMDSGLFFQARYNLGLSDVFSDADVKNTVLSISIGYFF